MSDPAALLARLRGARTCAEREAAARAVREFTGRAETWLEERARELCTVEWRDALARAATEASSDGERRWVCEAVCGITRCTTGQRVFSTEGVRDALVAMACAAGTDDARQWIARLARIVQHHSGTDNADGQARVQHGGRARRACGDGALTTRGGGSRGGQHGGRATRLCPCAAMTHGDALVDA
jgi:hypothetical protein